MSVEPLTLPAFAELAALGRASDGLPTAEPSGPPPSLPTVLLRADDIVALAHNHGLSGIRVVGSVARGTERAEGDLDLLVHRDDGDAFGLGRFQQAIEEMFGCQVDVIPDDELEQVAANPNDRSGRLAARLIAHSVAL